MKGIYLELWNDTQPNWTVIQFATGVKNCTLTRSKKMAILMQETNKKKDLVFMIEFFKAGQSQFHIISLEGTNETSFVQGYRTKIRLKST